MPPPASNDTGTALGQDGSDWLRDLATLTFDLEGHGACGWCGSSSSIPIPSLKFVGLAIWKIWRMICVNINGLGDLDLWPFDLESHQRWGTFLPNFGTLGLRVLQLFAMYATDGRTKATLIIARGCPLPYGRGQYQQSRGNIWEVPVELWKAKTSIAPNYRFMFTKQHTETGY